MSAPLSPRRTVLLLFSAVFLTTPVTWAAAPLQATARLNRTTVQVGEPVRVTVRVRGGEGVPEVQVPEVPGATVETIETARAVPSVLADLDPATLPGSPSRVPGQDLVQSLRDLSSQLAANAPKIATPESQAEAKLLQEYLANLGALSGDDYFYTYEVWPEQAGSITLPAFTVHAGNQTATTQPIALTVTGTKPQDWVRLTLSLSNPRPLVGEQVQLHADIWVRRREVKVPGRTFPHLPLINARLQLPPLDRLPQVALVQPLDQLVREHAPPAGHHGIHINNLSVEMVPEHEPAAWPDGQPDPEWYRRRVTVPLWVRQPGQVQIPTARVSGQVYVPPNFPVIKVGANDLGGKLESFVAVSSALSCTVRDVPDRPDRPRDFSGAVGELHVSTTASQTQLAVGTPFTLTVRLEGSGSLARISAPDLAGQSEFTPRFRVRPDDDRQVSNQVREFTYALRPLRVDVTEVPPVTVSYFNPTTDRFETARSQPILLQVSPAAWVEPPSSTAPLPPQPSGETPTGDLPILVKLPWILLGLLLAAAPLAWAVYRLKQRRRLPEALPAFPVAIPVLAHPLAPRFHSAHEVRQLVTDYLRTHFGLPEGEITPSEAAERCAKPEWLRTWSAAAPICCKPATPPLTHQARWTCRSPPWPPPPTA